MNAIERNVERKIERKIERNVVRDDTPDATPNGRIERARGTLRRLRILHCLRAPLGGLFRHVSDLTHSQVAHGHAVAILCAKGGTNALGERMLEELAAIARLGVTRIPMGRLPGPLDLFAVLATIRIARQERIDIIHGHGAKGGAFARLAAEALRRRGQRIAAVYTPHGGSLHYAPQSLEGRLFLGLERRLLPLSDGLIFESVYSRRVFADKVGTPSCPLAVVPNGLGEADFAPLPPGPRPYDFVFVGELRRLKGVDVLIEALARVVDGCWQSGALAERAEVYGAEEGGAKAPSLAPTPSRKRLPRTLIVGSGPDEAAFRALARERGLEGLIDFEPPMPARAAFARGRSLVVPSRAEAFPYIVLEAAAAGMPLLASDVGGIPEIVNGSGRDLLPPGDSRALARAMASFLADPEAHGACAEALRARVAEHFTIERMASGVAALYERALSDADTRTGISKRGADACGLDVPA